MTPTRKNEIKTTTNPGPASFDSIANGKQYDNIKNPRSWFHNCILWMRQIIRAIVELENVSSQYIAAIQAGVYQAGHEIGVQKCTVGSRTVQFKRQAATVGKVKGSGL